MNLLKQTCRELDTVHASYRILDLYQEAIRRTAIEFDLSENDVSVLIHIPQISGECTQKKLLGTNVRVSFSTISRSIENLRSKGFVQTRIQEKDRRSWSITLKELGTTAVSFCYDSLHTLLSQGEEQRKAIQTVRRHDPLRLVQI